MSLSSFLLLLNFCSHGFLPPMAGLSLRCAPKNVIHLLSSDFLQKHTKHLSMWVMDLDVPELYSYSKANKYYKDEDETYLLFGNSKTVSFRLLLFSAVLVSRNHHTCTSPSFFSVLH